jgi:hypothetical protein
MAITKSRNLMTKQDQMECKQRNLDDEKPIFGDKNFNNGGVNWKNNILFTFSYIFLLYFLFLSFILNI